MHGGPCVADPCMKGLALQTHAWGALRGRPVHEGPCVADPRMGGLALQTHAWEGGAAEEWPAEEWAAKSTRSWARRRRPNGGCRGTLSI
eukprot:5421370-Pleurochrysis_carterae.AAC.1